MVHLDLCEDSQKGVLCDWIPSLSWKLWSNHVAQSKSLRPPNTTAHRRCTHPRTALWTAFGVLHRIHQNKRSLLLNETLRWWNSRTGLDLKWAGKQTGGALDFYASIKWFQHIPSIDILYHQILNETRRRRQYFVDKVDRYCMFCFSQARSWHHEAWRVSIPAGRIGWGLGRDCRLCLPEDSWLYEKGKGETESRKYQGTSKLAAYVVRNNVASASCLYCYGQNPQDPDRPNSHVVDLGSQWHCRIRVWNPVTEPCHHQSRHLCFNKSSKMHWDIWRWHGNGIFIQICTCIYYVYQMYIRWL